MAERSHATAIHLHVHLKVGLHIVLLHVVRIGVPGQRGCSDLARGITHLGSSESATRKLIRCKGCRIAAHLIDWSLRSTASQHHVLEHLALRAHFIGAAKFIELIGSWHHAGRHAHVKRMGRMKVLTRLVASSHARRPRVLLTRTGLHRAVLLLHHRLLPIQVRLVRTQPIHSSRMKHWRVVAHEVDRHLVASRPLHTRRAAWIRYFKIAELLRIQALVGSRVPLWHSSILLSHPLLVLLLLVLLFDGGLVDERGRLRLTRRVLLLPLGTLLYPLRRDASWHV